MDEIKKYIDNIVKLINTEVANIAERCGVLVRKGATIASYDHDTKTATVYFDGDSTTASAPYFNKTGYHLSTGQRVYIFHLFGNPSQGWIMMRAAAYDDDESGSSGRICLNNAVVGYGNSLVSPFICLIDNISGT